MALHVPGKEHVTLLCMVGMETKLSTKNWQKMCEMCSHTFARMQGSIQDQKEELNPAIY